MRILLLLAFAVVLSACESKKEENKKEGKQESTTNPLLEEFNTPFGVPPLDKIKPEHYLPAYKVAFKKHMDEINAIADNPDAPDFENTIEAIDNSGQLLLQIDAIFNNLLESMSSDEMQNIAKELAPIDSKHDDDIKLNEKLFARVKAIYDAKPELTPEQNRLLEKTYKFFVRGGANLSVEDKDKLRKLNEELSLLELKYSENLLQETNSFQLVIEKKEDLAGLPESVVAGASEAASAANLDGKWLFTLQKPSLIPFLQCADNRELREKIYLGYINRGNNGNEFDNKETAKKISIINYQKAKLLGYKNYASFVLEENMAKTPEKVYELLNKLWKAALPNAKKELKELQAVADKEGKGVKIESWDWWYYTEKLKKEKFNFDDELLRPYFKLENVLEGAFSVANKLYGLTFKQRNDLPLYHPEAKTYEVFDADGSHQGILYVDWFPRESKSGGAWMEEFRGQRRLNGKEITPVITVVCNFSKPTGDKPALLNLDETLTLFHEFGHALHGLLSDGTYRAISGTAVSRDFVELPSQVMENWALEPEVLKMYAKHYKTGETIPDDLIEKIIKSGQFNQGFETVEYLAASFLDLNYQTIESTDDYDVAAFEKNALDKIGLIPEIISRYRTTYFGHIFGGGYAAGYYSYIWSGVLDSDAFEAFKETSLFDQETAKSFRDNILSKGSSVDAMELYKKFRGREPDIKPLLKKRGLI
ncbi:MAG: peptidase M3 [Bacteroidetes bacterium GWF2_38_335]|nr:MAG: peptidase M3 [Bacteroidetes bacterium GWF2_38_335]OFY80265.1 MAG: peptidase M3 [Bacteroidetes bacterium RIFOXYA12_FULL_38_20]HBS88715.1 peptidase M3 [Bacteroidales bacterium]